MKIIANVLALAVAVTAGFPRLAYGDE